jgi:hypothetical protein
MYTFRDIKRIYRNWKSKTHVLWHKDFKAGEYYEIDDKFLFCCFNELVQFVEIECSYLFQSGFMEVLPGQYVDKSVLFGKAYLMETQKTEELELYNWWSIHRPVREKQKELFAYNYDKELKHEQEDTEMLVRLMKIRNQLWS